MGVVELVARPRVFREGNVADLVGVLIGVGITIETVFGCADPGAGSVGSGEEGRVEVDFFDVPIGVVVDTCANRPANVQVLVDGHSKGWGRQQSQ
ncbi:hypothetical protein D3C81_1252340 [compost metagenome]